MSGRLIRLWPEIFKKYLLCAAREPLISWKGWSTRLTVQHNWGEAEGSSMKPGLSSLKFAWLVQSSIQSEISNLTQNSTLKTHLSHRETKLRCPLTSYTPQHVIYKATGMYDPASLPALGAPRPDSRPPHLTVSAKPAVPSLQAPLPFLLPRTCPSLSPGAANLMRSRGVCASLFWSLPRVYPRELLTWLATGEYVLTCFPVGGQFLHQRNLSCQLLRRLCPYQGPSRPCFIK